MTNKDHIRSVLSEAVPGQVAVQPQVQQPAQPAAPQAQVSPWVKDLVAAYGQMKQVFPDQSAQIDQFLQKAQADEKFAADTLEKSIAYLEAGRQRLDTMSRSDLPKTIAKMRQEVRKQKAQRTPPASEPQPPPNTANPKGNPQPARQTTAQQLTRGALAPSV